MDDVAKIARGQVRYVPIRPLIDGEMVPVFHNICGHRTTYQQCQCARRQALEKSEAGI